MAAFLSVNSVYSHFGHDSSLNLKLLVAFDALLRAAWLQANSKQSEGGESAN